MIVHQNVANISTSYRNYIVLVGFACVFQNHANWFPVLFWWFGLCIDFICCWICCFGWHFFSSLFLFVFVIKERVYSNKRKWIICQWKSKTCITENVFIEKKKGLIGALHQFCVMSQSYITFHLIYTGTYFLVAVSDSMLYTENICIQI